MLKKCKHIPWLFILTAVLTALIVSLGINFWKGQVETQTTEPENWITYTSENGFTFMHPEGFGVNETIDPENTENTIIHIVELDENGDFAEGVVPSLQINVSPNSVSFALWEGRDWEGYPDIIGTLKFD